jgi:hypothetical protein
MLLSVFAHLSQTQSLAMTFSHAYLDFSVLPLFLSSKLSFQMLVDALVFVQVGLNEPFVSQLPSIVTLCVVKIFILPGNFLSPSVLDYILRLISRTNARQLREK